MGAGRSTKNGIGNMDQIPTTLNIWHTFILLGAVQGFVLTLFLVLNKKGNRRANRVLAFLIFSISLDMLLSFLYLSKNIYYCPHLISISEPFYTLPGVLFYFYTKLLTKPRFTFKWQHVLFFLPFILETLLWMPFYFQPADLKLHAFADFENNESLMGGYWLVWVLELAYNLVFIFLTIKVLFRHRQKIKDRFSDISRINYDWLKKLAVAMSVVFIAQMVIVFTATDQEKNIDALFIALYSFNAILFYAAGYKGLKQPELFSGNRPAGRAKQEAGQKKYAKSSLTPDMAKLYLGQILKTVEGEKAYLKSDLKLKDLAAQLSISTNHISQVINEQLGKNFFDFINTYRVNEAKAMLADPDRRHLTLLAIAFEAGFSSKSAFNKTFKEQVGMTPSQFQKRELGEML